MKTTTKVYQGYSDELDITTIFEDTLIADEVVSTEIKGFYYGRPDNEGLESFYGKSKATF